MQPHGGPTEPYPYSEEATSPGLAQFCAYKTWKARVIRADPACTPPTMADFQEYQAMKRHSQIQDQGTHRDNQQPNPGTTLAPSNTSAIDPSLEIASRLDEVQKELASLKRRRDQEEEDDDDEEDDRRGRRRGRKGRSQNEQILTRYDAKLSGKERQVYKELKVSLRHVFNE